MVTGVKGITIFANAAEKNDSATVEAMQKLFDYTESNLFKVSWGTGAQNGTFGLKLQSVCRRTVLHVGTNGNLTICFGWLDRNTQEEELRDRLRELVVADLGFDVPEDLRKWPNYPASDWCPKVDTVIQTCKQLASEFA